MYGNRHLKTWNGHLIFRQLGFSLNIGLSLELNWPSQLFCFIVALYSLSEGRISEDVVVIDPVIPEAPGILSRLPLPNKQKNSTSSLSRSNSYLFIPSHALLLLGLAPVRSPIADVRRIASARRRQHGRGHHGIDHSPTCFAGSAIGVRRAILWRYLELSEVVWPMQTRV